jgi:hypothetical protein
MVAFDRFMWFVFSPALFIGLGVWAAVAAETPGARIAAVAATVVVAGVLYPVHVRYLINRRRRWRAYPA